MNGHSDECLYVKCHLVVAKVNVWHLLQRYIACEIQIEYAVGEVNAALNHIAADMPRLILLPSYQPVSISPAHKHCTIPCQALS